MKIYAEANPEISLTLDGKAKITFISSKNEALALENLKDKELILEVKNRVLRRSLSQNAYMWALIQELAIKLHITKEEVYKNYIRDYGQYEALMIQNKAVDKFVSAWQDKGLGWVAEVIRESKVKGCSVVLAYYGSSTYDRSQMNRLLDAIIEDCKEQGISTMSESELALLKNDN